MIHLSLHSEYTFKQCYYPLQQLVHDAAKRGDKSLGIADQNNSFAHIKFQTLCNESGIKPIFGVRLNASKEIIKKESVLNSNAKGWSANRSHDGLNNLIFLAKNDKGLQ